MSNTVTFSKGSISVALRTQEVTDNLSNKLFLITPPQTASNQTTGPKDTKIVDLLRITREFILRSYITPETDKTAKSIKEDLVDIAKGASTAGGVVTMIYDGDTYTGIIEKLTIRKFERYNFKWR